MQARIYAIALILLASTGPLNADEDPFQIGLDAYLAGDYDQAFARWQPLAREGDKVAAFNLGVLYARGLGVEQNLPESVVWYRRSAEAGYAPAQFNLGSALMEGAGVARNKTEAADWWAKAAAQDYSHALFNLGTLHLRGDGVSWDQAKARELYRRAAELGDARALRVLERLEAQAKSAAAAEGSEKPTTVTAVPKDESAAVVATARPARTESAPDKPASPPADSTATPAPTEPAPAPNNVAERWLQEQPHDHYTVQLFAFQDLAAARSFIAEKQLSDIVLVAADVEGQRWYKAFHGSYAERKQANEVQQKLKTLLPQHSPWLRKFTDVKAEMVNVVPSSGYTDKQETDKREENAARGTITATPPVVESEVLKLSKAATPPIGPDRQQQLRLGQLAFNGQKYDEALKRWEPLAEKGVADAQYGLAFMYESGRGVDRDYQKAFQWYSAAAEQGHVKSQFNLGLLYRNGQGVAQNEALGLYWIQNAADRDEPRAQEFLRRETRRRD